MDRVITVDEDTREPLSRPKFVVTFPEYGNTEIVTLGELDMPGGSGSSVSHRGRPAGRGKYSDSRLGRDDRHDNRRGDSYDQRDGGSRGHDRRRGYERGQYRRDERWERDSRDRKRSRSRERNVKPPLEMDLMEEVRRQEREKSLSQGKSYASRPPSTKESLSGAGGRGPPADDDRAHGGHPHHRPAPEQDMKPDASPPKKKSPEELAAIQEKKRKLLAKYG